MPETTGSGVTLRGLNGLFNPSLANASALWKELCSIVGSDGASEIYKWLGQIPTPVEWRGKRRSKAMRDYGQTIVNKAWELMVEIDRHENADDQTGQLQMRVRDAAKRFAQHPDKLLVDLMIAAESTLCYDGQYFFDTDHSEGDSGTQSNLLTSDIATPAAPTLAEFEAAFWLAIKAMAGFKDDQGEPWNPMTGLENLAGILVVIPVSYLDVASKVLGVNAAPIISQTSNILAGKARIMATPRITWTTKFAIFKTDDEVRPFIFQNRQAVQTSLKDDPEEKAVKYMADGRYAVGYGLWQKAVMVSFT